MKKFIIICLLSITPLSALAAISPADTGLAKTGGQIYGTQPSIAVFLGTYIIGPALGILGVVFLLLMFYSGVLWMTGGGNDAQITKAKSILTNSIIGLVLIVASYAVSQFLVNILGA
ncbi:MAG: hypothetical protein ABH826_00295 [Patescibacteria group bacterium]